ncbi:MAG: 3-methyl-2-oxobutanoate hydroxymethyltransferase [Thiotrichales bacterium]|nr:3-methyl-2-oxobutanoate hydroxymethyltransferase [Thiotrichales bacterium]
MNHSELNRYKEKGEKITCLTAYDASMASLIDNAGVDTILVGDSLGMVIQGAENTRSVTMQDMMYHTSIVASACRHALVIADMPFHSYDDSESALNNAKSLIDQGAKMVKIEGGSEHTDVIKTLISNNINVCGHLGLQPQLVTHSSDYKVQGREESSAQSIINNAILLESLGVSVLVLECIPSHLAKIISDQIKIPTIGIGAGRDCDGQVLVSFDMLGITSGKQPRFVRNFLNSQGSVSDAVKSFIKEVKQGTFPSDSESY